MPSTAFSGLFGLQICSLKLCGSVVDRISAVFKRVFVGSWSARARTLRKHAKLGCSYFNDCGRGNRSPSAYKPNSHAPGQSRCPHLSGRSKPPPCVAPPPLRADGSRGIEFKQRRGVAPRRANAGASRSESRDPMKNAQRRHASGGNAR